MTRKKRSTSEYEVDNENLIGKCPAGHPLSDLIAYNNERQCDVCGGMICENSSFGACEECGYDTCAGCSNEKRELGWNCKISRRSVIVKMMLTISSFIVLIAGFSTTAACIQAMHETSGELALILRERESYSIGSVLETLFVQPLYVSNVLYHKIVQKNITLNHATPDNLKKMKDVSAPFLSYNLLLFAVNVSVETIAAVGFRDVIEYENTSFRNHEWQLRDQAFTTMVQNWTNPLQVNWTTVFSFPSVKSVLNPGIACVRGLTDQNYTNAAGVFIPLSEIEDQLSSHIFSPGHKTVLLGASPIQGNHAPISIDYEINNMCNHCKGGLPLPSGCSTTDADNKICSFSETGLLFGSSLRAPIMSNNITRIYPHESSDKYVYLLGVKILKEYGSYDSFEKAVMTQNVVGDFLSFSIDDSDGEAYFVDVHIIDIYGKRLIVLHAVKQSTAFARYNSEKISITILATWVVLSSYTCSVIINLRAIIPMAEVKVLLTHRIRKVRAAYSDLNNNLTTWGKDQARADEG